LEFHLLASTVVLALHRLQACVHRVARRRRLAHVGLAHRHALLHRPKIPNPNDFSHIFSATSYS
jgi:hypothetical protein